VKRLRAFLAGIETIHSRCCQSRGQQGPLNRIGWLAGQEHPLHAIHQRTEKNDVPDSLKFTVDNWLKVTDRYSTGE
jgi:hypothetical protein